MEWKNIVGAIAPVLGTALGGPLGGAAAKVIASAVLGEEKQDADVSEVSTAIVAGLSPETIAKLKEADIAFKTRMKELDIDILKLNAASDAAYLADTQSARDANKGDKAVFWLGIAILVTFAALMGAALYASMQLLTGGIVLKDVAVVSVVSGLVGTIIGYVAGNAQQVVGYYFGSSKGSSEKTNAMATAMSDAVRGAAASKKNP